MRAFAFSLIALLSVAEVHSAEPRFRPALIGNGPKALINLIDTKKLMEKGQRGGLLMFKCYADGFGGPGSYWIYRETPGSELLKEEVGNAISRCRFIPAIYDGKRTDVELLGTVVFVVADGKPHVHIFMNQNHDDLARGNDFIAPQLVADSVDFKRRPYDWAGHKTGEWVGQPSYL